MQQSRSRITNTSHDVQNKLLEIVAHTIIRSRVCKINEAKFFSLIADETTDSSRKQQVAIVLRWVDSNFDVSEDFFGFHEMPYDATAATLTCILKDCLLRLGLQVSVRIETGIQSQPECC